MFRTRRKRALFWDNIGFFSKFALFLQKKNQIYGSKKI